jgi:hypothetical protein
MVDVYSDREAQQAVNEIALMLQSLSERLEEIAGSLCEPADAEAMYDGKRPYSVSVDLKGAIECSVTDDLQPAVKRLRKAASATEESLRREYRDGGGR